MDLKLDTVLNGLKDLSAVHEVKMVEGTVQCWFKDLKDLPDEVVSAAFDDVRRTFKPRFYGDKPTPAHIREHIVNVCAKGWTSAFEECMSNASQVNSPLHYTNRQGKMVEMPVRWSSPIVKKCFYDFGGASAFLSVSDGDRTSKAQFRDTYQRILGRVQSGGIAQIGGPIEETRAQAIARPRDEAINIEAGGQIIKLPVKRMPDAFGG